MYICVYVCIRSLAMEQYLADTDSTEIRLNKNKLSIYLQL